MFENPLWQPSYDGWDLQVTLRRIDDLNDRLSLDDEAVNESITFAKRAFAEWSGDVAAEQADFLFVVPTRLRRDNRVYGSEVHSFLPVLPQIGPVAGQVLAASIPPFTGPRIPGQGDVQGFVYSAQVYLDAATDLGQTRALKHARNTVDQIVSHETRRRGVKLIGLGATLPGLTRFGTTITSDVVTTTGHGATVALMVESILKAALGDLNHQPIGILGLGSIGGSVA